MSFVFNRGLGEKLLGTAHGLKSLYYIMQTLAPWSKHGGWLSETDATEHIYGSSGRGSPQAKRILQYLAAHQILESYKKGRATYYHVPPEVYEFARLHSDFRQEHFDQECLWLTDDTRPMPKMNRP